jgi:Icc-related predicted phosphoesterase
MKIGLFSDLHLEHHNSKSADAILKRVADTAQGVDLLVNAGDTHHDPGIRDTIRSYFEGAGFKYIDVLGNHDWYGHEWSKSGVVDIWTNVGAISGTMWTDFNRDWGVELAAQEWISDFRYIKGVSTEEMQKHFELTLEIIENEKSPIVITHFAPSPLSIHPKWAGNMLNGYFCPDALGQLKHRPKLWVHGHIHDPVDYVIEGTRVVANPFGYPYETYQDIEDYSVKVIEI